VKNKINLNIYNTAKRNTSASLETVKSWKIPEKESIHHEQK